MTASTKSNASSTSTTPAAAATTTPTSTTPAAAKPQSPPPTTTTTTTNASPAAGGMLQRMKEIEAMIAAGKQEMDLLQAAECIKIQALARGFLQRRKLRKTSSPKPTLTKKANTNNATPKRKKKKVKKAVSAPNAKTKDDAETHTKDNKAAESSVPATAPATTKETAAKTANSNNNSPQGVEKEKPEKKISEGSKTDHYAWNHSSTGGYDGDHYDWNGGNGTEAAAKAKDKKGMATKNNTPPPSSRRRSLTKDQANAIKNGSKQKSKTRRVNSLKDNSSNTNNHHNNNGMSEYSWKDHSMRDQSMKDASQAAQSHSMKDQSMADHSMPFSELIVDKNKDSSGSITNLEGVSHNVMAVAYEEDEVFEDSDNSDNDDKESRRSSAASSRRSMGNSSFVSKLTDNDSYDGGSLTSKDDAWSDALSKHGERSEDDEEEPDLLDLSVMATAQHIKQTPSELTEKDLLYFGGNEEKEQQKSQRKKKKRQEQEDDLSVSVMALDPRRSDDDSEDDLTDDDDDSLASYAYNTEPKSSSRRRKHRHDDDDFDDSVMAVAEMSDLEDVETEFEFEDDFTEYEDDGDFDDDESDFYYDDKDDDLDDDLNSTVMAVALPGDGDYDDGGDDDASVAFNPREDDMSITSVESNLPREESRRDHRRRRRHEVDDYEEDDEDDIVDAEDVSVLSTESNKRHKKSHHKQRAKRKSKKSSDAMQPQSYNNQFLLPQYPTDSSEEESYLQRKRRQRRSRRSMSQKVHLPHHQQVDPENDEELRNKLEEINQLIEESRKDMEALKEAECIKIQAFVRMHRERKMMDSSGQSVPEMRSALSRTGTKKMNSAATAIQAIVRGFQARVAYDIERRSRKRRRNRKQRRAREIERKTAEGEARQQAQLEKVENEMKRRQQALEVSKSTLIQAHIRGFFVRSKNLLNPERIAAIKIQRFIRAALRVISLRKRLETVVVDRVKEVQEVEENKKKTIAEFEPGKFDNMDTRVKMVNFLKKQIEKENETTEKLVTKIKNVKENNVRLMTANSSSVCTVAKLELDVKTKEEKREAMLKLNQQWLDGIKEYEHRIETVIKNTKMLAWNEQVHQKYIPLLVEKLETRYPAKKLVKEIKFMAKHASGDMDTSVKDS